jgi:uncharacterized RDD family membrane protein YckC
MSERPTNPPSGLTSGDPLNPDPGPPPREPATPLRPGEAEGQAAVPPAPTGAAEGERAVPPGGSAGGAGGEWERPAAAEGGSAVPPRRVGEAERAPHSAGEQFGGYTSAPPPGAFTGGPVVTPPAYAPGARQLAGWWSRVAATLLDGLIISVGGLLLMILFGAVFSAGFFASEEAGVASVIIGLMLAFVAFAIISLLYAPWMMARTDGRTLGRMAVGIRVVRASGEPVTFGWAMLREVAVKWLLFGAVLSSITFGLAWLLDVLWPLWDEENRALHDMIVDSRVVKD